MARRNSRFVNQKVIIGNKSVQLTDLTDSAVESVSGVDSNLVKSVVGYNSLNLTNTDQLLTTAGALSDAGLLKTSMDAHESLLNGLNNSIKTRGDSFIDDEKFIQVVPTEQSDSNFYLILATPPSYVPLQETRFDTQEAAGTIDSFREFDILDSFWIDNTITNNNRIWYDSAGNNTPILKYKLNSVSQAINDLHSFFGTRAGIDSDTVIQLQVLDSARSTDTGAFAAQDDSNVTAYYTVLDSITAPLAETILNREFFIPANVSFHKGSLDSFNTVYSPQGRILKTSEDLTTLGVLVANQSSGTLNTAAYRVRKHKSAFRFKTALSDGLVAEPVWSRVSSKFKYVIPKPGRGYNPGTQFGETAGSYRDRRAYFPFASDTFIASPTVTGSIAALDTLSFGVNYGDTNSSYWSYASFASAAVSLGSNFPEPQQLSGQEGTSGTTYGVMQGGFIPGSNTGSRNSFGVNFANFSKVAVPLSPNAGQSGHGVLSAPTKGYYMGGNNVNSATSKRARWDYSSGTWGDAPGMGYAAPGPGNGIRNSYGMSNDTYGHYGGGTGPWPSYNSTNTGKQFPHSSDGTLTTRNVYNRFSANVTGNSTSWYMWDGRSGPENGSTAQSGRYRTTYNSGSWVSLPTALSDAGHRADYGDGHWW